MACAIPNHLHSSCTGPNVGVNIYQIQKIADMFDTVFFTQMDAVIVGPPPISPKMKDRTLYNSESIFGGAVACVDGDVTCLSG